MAQKGDFAMGNSDEKLSLLRRIAAALEALAPQTAELPALSDADAFVWHGADKSLKLVPKVNALPLSLLLGIDRQKAELLENTVHFTKGYGANNVLLWGARGMGKSSLIKSVHAHINDETPHALVLIEIHREDIASLPDLLTLLSPSPRRFIVFCDDLSFEKGETSYKSLKAVLEGGLEGRPANVLFYATSNRRHLIPRDMMENERSTAISPAEAIEEAVSLSDRFGLWLGLHSCSQADYLAMVESYANHFELKSENLHAQALEWAQTRGARSGRVAWQFIQDLAGKLGKSH
ncbi:MAG: ATP-binding protein [Sphingomonadales bacterium]|jgi:predicted AAA+ superfamily ATPase